MKKPFVALMLTHVDVARKIQAVFTTHPMDPRNPESWSGLGGSSGPLTMKLAALSRARDIDKGEIDICDSALHRYCSGLSSREGRIKLAAIWDNSLADFYVEKAQAIEGMSWDWWARNTILIAIEPVLLARRSTSVEWCFSDLFADPSDDPGLSPRDRRQYLGEPVRGFCYILKIHGMSDSEGQDVEHEQALRVGQFSEDEADESDPAQYECHVLAERHLTWRFVIAVDPRSENSSVRQEDQFNAIDPYWSELGELLLGHLDRLFAEEGRDLFVLAEQARNHCEVDIDFLVEEERYKPFVYLFPARKRASLRARGGQHRVIYDKEAKLQWSIRDIGRTSNLPGIEPQEALSGEDALKNYFTVKRLFSIKSAKQRRQVKAGTRSNAEYLVAESLTEQGFLVSVEPPFVFPVQQVDTYRTPDLLVIDGGRMIAIEIDDSYHLFGRDTRGAWQQWQRDRDFDNLMLQHGIPVYRISVKEAMRNPVKVVSEVSKIFASLGGSRMRYQ